MALISAALLSACGDSPEQMLASAKAYLSKNDSSAAAIQLKNALQEDGNLAEARFLLGRINLEQGDVPGAVKELQRAFELGYAKTEVVPLLARARIRAGEFDRVLSDFGSLELDDPAAQGTLLGAVADAHFGKANVSESIRIYQQALVLRADDADAGIGLARARIFNNDPVGAEEAVRAVIAHSPDNGNAFATLSDALQVQGKQEEALKALEEALRLRPDNAAYHYTLISQLFRSNRYDDGVERFEAMKKVAPNHPSTRYLQAFIDVRAGRLTEARDGLMGVLKQAPDFLPAQLLAGTVLLRLNDQAQGRSYLNSVLSRAPGQLMARTQLIGSHLSSGEAPRALELLQPLLEAPTNDARILGLAGQVFLANGDFAKAEDFLQRAAKAAPEDPQARLRLGAARLAGGDAEGAFADFESASEMDDTAIQADLALVAAYLRRGEADKALEAQAQLERKQPQNPLVYNLRGGVMLAKQDVPAARAAFEKALSLNPDFLSAALNLARLDIGERKVEEALARVRAIADRNEKNAEARLSLAELQLATGAASADVLATLERAEAAAPGTLPPALAIIQHHLRNREFPKALAAAQKLGSAYPNDVRAVEALARAQLAASDTQQGIASLNKLAALRPQSAAPLIMLADVHRGAKDNAAAEQALRKALALRPDAIDVQQRLAGLLLERGDSAGALKIARNVQQQHAESAAGHVLEAEIEAAGSRWAEAVSAYRRAIERKAGGDVAARLHSMLVRADRKGEADRFAADWLRQQPKDLAMRGYLAERALAEARYADAADGFGAMNEASPNNPLVLNNLAWAANQLKDPKALGYAEQALSFAPDNPAILDTLGVIQIERGQADKGLANIQRAVSLAPELAELRLSLARSYAKLERKDDARKELDTLMPKLQDGTPLHKQATELLKSL
nr:XrtA/PEP-CTERM system TPR-repeat protein PrsT [Thauera linaloolentis]